MRNQKRLAFIFLILVFLVGACSGSQQTSDPITYRITVLHFNDLHGYLQAHRSPSHEQIGDMARMAQLIEDIRNQNLANGVPTILLFAGDLLQGSPISSVYHGKADIEVLNRIGIDAAVPGNHEYDYGPDNFNEIVEESNFPWIVGNLRKINHESPWLPTGIIKRYPRRFNVAIFGVTTGELVTATHPRNVQDLVVDDPVVIARKLAPRHNSASDLLIVLSHCGIATDRQIAQEVPGIDVIIGAHNHNLYQEPIVENGVLIVQAGEYGEYLGRLDLEVTDDRAKLVRYKVYPITPDLPANPMIESMIQGYMNTIAERSNEVIGRTLVELNGKRDTVRRTESNLGDYVCDAIRERFSADIVLLNGGSFRDSMYPGDITVGDVLRVFPFGNTLVAMTVSGSSVRAALERGLQDDPLDNPGSFLQVSGLVYQIDGRRAVNIKIDDQPLRDDQLYKVIVNDFMAAGGDHFTMLKDIPDTVDTGYTLADVVVEAIRKQGEIKVHADGRIKRIAPWAAD